MVWLLDVLKNKRSSGNLGHQKYDGVLIWDTPVGTVIPEDQATSVLLKMMNADFYKVDVKPQFMLNFLNSVDVFQDKSIADEKLRTFFDKISYQAGSEFIKFDWHSGFIGWETKFGQDSAVSIQRKFILLKKAINLLSFIVSNKNIYIGEQKEIILSQGMSDFFLFADDILSEFSYEKAYFDKQFRVDLGKVCDFIGGFNVNENYTAYKNQIVHYFLLKTKNFLPDYSFNSEITLDKNSGFTKYVGVSYYLSADLFKYSNLVFFSVKDLENMYIFASNHFADSELIVTTKSKNQSMNHKDRMRIIDEGTSFVFEHEKIRGYLNFPDVFEEIMKKSFVQALNDVISHQMDYKTIVEDLAITGSFDSKNTFQVAVEALKGNKTDSIVRVDKLFELIDKFGASFNNGFKFSSLPGFKDAKELILSGQQIPSNNLWISKVNGLIESKYKNTFASNVLRALVYVDIKQENIIDATVRTFVWEMKKYSHDESLFKSFSFDARESRERVFKSVFNVGKNCVECFYDYFANDLIINKIYSQDDYLCSKMMELIIKDWEDEKDKDSSFAKAIKVKDFYALVVLNSSSEYENIFVEKYASVVDKIYHKYVYEVSREDTRIVMVNNFHLNKFWAYRENKGVSIRQMWAMLKRLKSSENDLKKVFDESKLKVKIDGDVGTSPAYNDTVSVILKFNKYDQKIANRLIPLWIKHCLVSDDLSFAKLKEMYDVGKMSTVSES